ncbi:MAG: hypothetical protein HY716_04195 [Planctomycetes bacterium]|nr:hypothetical protein [Planctomycetota bacterium]
MGTPRWICVAALGTVLLSPALSPTPAQGRDHEPRREQPTIQESQTGAPHVPNPPVTPAEAVHVAVRELLEMQEDTGRWSYEAYYRDIGEPEGLPYGFQVGGTSIVATALLFAAPDDKDVLAAVRRGLAFVLRALAHEKMAPRRRESYDVRIWGHCFALEFLCRLRARRMAAERAADVDHWIPRLVKTIADEEIPGGGWNYASLRTPASFVTAPMVQALLLARSQGEHVSGALLERARNVLAGARMKDGAFRYAEATRGRDAPVKQGPSSLPGSASRSVVCEATLRLLGESSPDALQLALENFHRHWSDMEMLRGKPGTHQPPHAIASYYFYFSHRYAAQLIELLPRDQRARERERLAEMILMTRGGDGTWNDRIFTRSRNVGTAFALLALLAERVPPPPTWRPTF